MKKNNLNYLKIFFIISTIVTSGIIVFILFSNTDKKLELITGLLSVTVTLILGVITYFQTKEQTQIDMIDKTPYFRIVKDTEYENHAREADIDINVLYQYTKFLRYGNYGAPIGAVVRLEVENVSDCIIKRVKKYVCADKKLSDGGKFVPYNDTQLVQLFRDPGCKVYEYHNNFNLNGKEFDLIQDDKFEISLIAADNIPNNSEKQYDFSVALEIETVHGYEYTQYMEFSVKAVPVFTAADWVTITDYDVFIIPGQIKKKYLDKK